MFIKIIFLYLLNFLLLLCVGQYLGAFGVIFIIFNNLLWSMLFSISFFIFFLKNTGIFIFSTNFFFLDFLYSSVEWIFIIDSITAVMLIVVSIVSFFVHLYSISYMRFDPHLIRFLSLLSLFTFCMLLLVTSSNFIQLFFGWEGVGICSYLLINFWFTRIQANKSAFKAMFMNRIGDISLLLGISFYYYVFRTFDFSIGFLLVDLYKYVYFDFFFFNVHFLSLLSFLFFFAAIGKSAQLGLHTWLPDAMEGPTPVSALIHAATMVTAGVFLIIRLSFIYEYSFINVYILLFGAITAFFGSFVAAVQFDLKRVIAYSTCSQLGYMMVACGLFRYELALFHLFNHAFFKALLFLASGVIIHALDNEQDMRKMGLLNRLLPITYLSIFLGSYALLGFPFLSGYYSKDFILELACSYYDFYSIFSCDLILLAAFFTAFYSYRLIVYIFYGTAYRGHIKNIIGIAFKDADLIMIIVFFFLGMLSICVGFFFKDLFVGAGSYFIIMLSKPILFNNFFSNESLDIESKLLPLFYSIFGLYVGYILFVFNINYEKNSNNKKFYTINDVKPSFFFLRIYTFISNKWYFDIIYNYFFSLFIQELAYKVTYKLVDKNFLELFGVTGIYVFSYNISYIYKYIYGTGFIYLYIFTFMVGCFFMFLLSLVSDYTYIYIYILYVTVTFSRTISYIFKK